MAQLQDPTQTMPEESSNDEIRLDQVWQIVKRRWLPAALIFSGITAAVAAYGFNQTPIYEAEGKLRFKTRDAASALTGINDERGELESLDSRESPISTEIGVIRTTPMMQKVIDELGLTNEDGEPLDPRKILGNLEVSQENGTDILALAYQSPAPETAEQIVNVLMETYLEEHLLNNRAEAVAARVFIERQLPGAEARAQQAEAALRDFKERNDILELQEETRLTVSSLDQLEDQMTAVKSALADTDAQFRVLRARMGKDPQSALVATALSQAPGIQSILTELQTVEAQIATEQVRFYDQHPTVVDLQTRQANLRQVLFQRIEAVLGPGTLPANVEPRDG